MWRSLTTTAPVTFVEAHAPSANETDSVRQTKHLMEPEMTADALVELLQLV